MRLDRLRTPGFALFVALATACTSEASPAPTAAPDPTSESAIDRSADPCKDFYRYACGAWLDAHEGEWAVRITTSRYEEVPLVQSILEDDFAGRRAADDPYAAVVGAYLRACIAAPSSTSGRQALTSELGRIDAIASVDDLAGQIAVQRDLGSYVLVGVGTASDLHDPTRRIVTLDQLGGELPDRSYYLDASLEGLRTRYRAHVAAVAAELGGAFDADAAVAVETALAKASLSRTERRDARALDHPMTRTELDAAAPGLPWKRLLTAAGFEGVERVNAAVPSYLTAVAAYVAVTPLDTLKSYLKWQLVHDSMLALDAPLRALDFAFFQRAVRGLGQPSPTT